MTRREQNDRGKRTPRGDKYPKKEGGRNFSKPKSEEKIDFDDPNFWDKIEKELDFELYGEPHENRSEKSKRSNPAGENRNLERNSSESRYNRTRRDSNTAHRDDNQRRPRFVNDRKNTDRYSKSEDSARFSSPKPERDFSRNDRNSRSNKREKEDRSQGFNRRNKEDYPNDRRNDYGKHERRTDRPRTNEQPTYNQVGKEKPDDLIRLNRYIANSGVCSRREADELIKKGEIQVNGQVITELGFKVKPSDVVTYQGKRLNPEKKVYLLLNKPKDTLTTMKDPEGRRTVFDLIQGATRERVFPVGRLDRNTSGLLLLTNDGELADRLAHPSSQVEKLYHVVLDRNFEEADFEKLLNGIELEDGFIAPDHLSYANDSRKELGVEIHSGRNRIVRRMFEHLGYKVTKLDRVLYAGLTKKGLERGAWRFLTPNEVRFLYSKTASSTRGKSDKSTTEE